VRTELSSPAPACAGQLVHVRRLPRPATSLAETHGLNIELKLTASGFVLVIKPEKKARNSRLVHVQLPSEFINVVHKAGGITCTTLDLVRPRLEGASAA